MTTTQIIIIVLVVVAIIALLAVVGTGGGPRVTQIDRTVRKDKDDVRDSGDA